MRLANANKEAEIKYPYPLVEANANRVMKLRQCYFWFQSK